MILRSVYRTKSRFLSILAIVAVGVGFLGGLLSTAPDMQLTADKYYDDYRFFDIDVKGTMGLTDDDADELSKLECVDRAMPARVTDVNLDCLGEAYVTRVYGVDLSARGSDGFINDFELVDGRMPENAGECLIASPNGYTSDHKVGEVFTISASNRDIEGTYAFESLTVSGIVRCPQYMSIEREPSTVGTGRVNVIMFVYPECYALEPYTDIFLRLTGAAELNTFSDKYFELVDNAEEKLDDFGKERSDIRFESIKSNASAEIADAKKQYNDSKDRADRELAAAKGKIDDAETQIKDAEAKLEASRAEYTAKKAEIEAKRSELTSAYETLERTVAASKANAERKYGSNTAALEAALAAIEKTATEQRASLDAADTELNGYETALGESEKSLSDAAGKIETEKNKLADARREYDESEKKAREELADAETKIKDAEEKLESLDTPSWYITDRRDNISFNSYRGNSNKINAIARVFPVFFFFVAALVALTTMTRMVEEERTQMGTLKALGYSDGVIMAYYLAYSVLASALGSLVGAAIGFRSLPKVIAGAYSMLYDVPATLTPFRWNYFAIITPIAIVCTSAATFAACISELRERPASLMRQRAPKAGKRIFLERISIIWRHLGFTAKVTARNIIRYKKRFFMTVFGIAGCTALLLTAFGLRDSIHDIVDKQFGDIYKYDLTVYVSSGTDVGTDRELSDFLASGYTRGYLAMHTESGKIGKEGLAIQVTDDPGSFRDFVTLRERKSGKSIDFTADTDGVILTEKICETLGVKVGDTVELQDADGMTAAVRVAGITENYVTSYCYMTDKTYEAAFGHKSETNMLLVGLTADDAESRDAAAQEILKSGNILMMTFSQTIRESFSNTVKKIDYIVMVLIFSAGLLAVIVVYNLTNINICERRKELATLRVLGFHNSETASYIYRETGILTVVGILVGFAFGVWLHSFVVRTAEVDSVMFGRSVYAASYLWAALVTAGFAAAVDLMMYPVIKRIDMVEAMKANE